jgi:hypothetical protein
MKNSGNWVIGKVRIFGASKNPVNEHFSGIIQKNGVFSGDLRKTSGGSFSDASCDRTTQGCRDTAKHGPSVSESF